MGISVVYNKIARLQNRMLPMSVVVMARGKKVLSAEVESAAGLSPEAPELTPPANLSPNTSPDPVEVSQNEMQQLRVKATLVRPSVDRTEGRASGTVVLEALIGTDGRIHNLSLVDGPSRSLIEATKEAVSQWGYEPYKLTGQPVEVRTTVSVYYNMGGVTGRSANLLNNL